MIHYHGTPVGGPRADTIRFLAGRHALVPWSYPEDIGTVAEACQSFCLDNGAFTAWKSGKPIEDWGGYYEWVKLWHRHPGYDFAIIPDVIDGSEADNEALIAEWQKRGLHKGFPQLVPSGVPVWHLHESLERLERLVRLWRRVALGSSGQWPNPNPDPDSGWYRRMAEAMEVLCDSDGRPRVKIHGLRMLNPAIFSLFPLASADSTNAVRNGNLVKRFGMYCPPYVAARQALIAQRIEAHNSACRWVVQESAETQETFEFVGIDE